MSLCGLPFLLAVVVSGTSNSVRCAPGPLVFRANPLARAATVGASITLPTLATAGQTPGQQPATDAGMDAAAQNLLQRYSGALESLDADAVKKVQPSIDVERLKKALADMRALAVHIDSIKVLSSAGDAARVSCRVTQTLTPRAGSKQTTTVTRVMRLRKQNAAWVIDAFER
jgi:hypothetical protein